MGKHYHLKRDKNRDESRYNNKNNKNNKNYKRDNSECDSRSRLSRSPSRTTPADDRDIQNPDLLPL